MISAGDFRNGVTLEIEGNVYQILEFQHVKPGKGAAFVRTKLKNIINGGVVEKTFRPTEKFPAARIDRVDMQYLYSDGDLFHFMRKREEPILPFFLKSKKRAGGTIDFQLFLQEGTGLQAKLKIYGAKKRHSRKGE